MSLAILYTQNCCRKTGPSSIHHDGEWENVEAPLFGRKFKTSFTLCNGSEWWRDALPFKWLHGEKVRVAVKCLTHERNPICDASRTEWFLNADVDKIVNEKENRKTHSPLAVRCDRTLQNRWLFGRVEFRRVLIAFVSCDFPFWIYIYVCRYR